ncbi:hypothetical protein [Kutzneria buriramensis]|uniref:Uncharacterized protein n=1 Tax=Kutzneria buriramensis TaxID=1045776 RepID=A0A3E0H7C5_9PSEU|nr:hypothetical protein [Kutzneria buriramensis]REH39157.1 hypothetical protein BCF44_11311 [Kutzneria buriramensis]
MLIKRAVLDGIADGSMTMVFRRWRTVRVRVGTHLRTAVGVLVVESIDQVAPAVVLAELDS